MSAYRHHLATSAAILVAIVSSLMLTSCFNNESDKFHYRNGYIVYEYWTFSFGTVTDTLHGADSTSFEILRNGFARDKSHVWYNSYPIDSADITTFEVIKGYYARDNRHIFYKYNLMETADYATFKAMDKEHAKDKNTTYYMDVDEREFDELPDTLYPPCDSLTDRGDEAESNE